MYEEGLQSENVGKLKAAIQSACYNILNSLYLKQIQAMQRPFFSFSQRKSYKLFKRSERRRFFNFLDGKISIFSFLMR